MCAIGRNSMQNKDISRRDFIRLTALGASAVAIVPAWRHRVFAATAFPEAEHLGRVAVTPNFYSTVMRSRPDENAPAVRNVGQDEVVIWQREVVGSNVTGRSNRRWVETPDGFVYAVDLQPVENRPNNPIGGVPTGRQGFWTEITVPYVELILPKGAVPVSPSVKFLMETNQPVRLYYGQVIWVDQVGAGPDGSILYRVNEAPGHGYGAGDLFYADARAFKVLTDKDVEPISPNVDSASKKIVVDATPGYQTLSCMEGTTEVYFCRVSTGYGEKYSTPAGDQSVSWKTPSIHMAANTGSDSGYDTMGVPWPVFFNRSAGAAIHGAFWHNDFGTRRSHGCVNVSPADAKWIFRWTTPAVSLDQSEIRLDWPNVGGAFSTSVTVIDSKA